MGLSRYDRLQLEERVTNCLTVGGMTELDTATQLNLTITQVKRIIRKRKDRLETYHAAIATSLTKTQLGLLAEQREALFSDLPLAVSEIRSLLKNRNPRIRLDAATRLMDRIGLTAGAAERLLEQTGLAKLQKEPASEAALNIFLLAVKALASPVHIPELPPTPPALLVLQERNIIDVVAEKVSP